PHASGPRLEPPPLTDTLLNFALLATFVGGDVSADVRVPMPSAAVMAPQQSTLPSVATAQLSDADVAMLENVALTATFCGAECGSSVLSPSAPEPFVPQHAAVPPTRIPHVSPVPALRLMNCPATGVGFARTVFDGATSAFCPQQKGVPPTASPHPPSLSISKNVNRWPPATGVGTL